MGALIGLLGIGRIKNEFIAMVRYAGGQAALTVAMALVGVIAAAFGITSLLIWLSNEYGAAAAFGMVAGGLLVIALILQIVMMIRSRRRERVSMLSSSEPTDTAATSMNETTASSLAAPAAIGSLAVLAVVGYVIGRQAGRF